MQGLRSQHEFLLGLTALLLLASTPARADWPPQGATIKGSITSISSIESCSDGAAGAFAVWQESPSQGQPGILYAQHVPYTGGPDPTWPPEGFAVCTVVAQRTLITALSDGFDGCYVLWSEGTEIYLSRITSAGAVAAGWPARGALLGIGEQATAFPDTDHGVFAAWGRDLGEPDNSVPVIIRIGPDGTQTGWSGGPLQLRPQDGNRTREMWLKMAPAPDGGVYLGWVTFNDPNELLSYTHLARINADGTTPPGWPGAGIDIEQYHWMRVIDGTTGEPAPLRSVDLAEDGRGGVFFLTNLPTGGSGDSYLILEVRLRRFGANGTTAPGWPTGGRVVPWPNGYPTPVTVSSNGTDSSPLVISDGHEGGLVGMAWIGTETSQGIEFRRWSDAPTSTGGYGSASPIGGRRVLPNGTGGLYFGGVFPIPFNMYPATTPAFIRVAQGPAPPGWTGFYEAHSDICPCMWFPAIGLTTTSDGGAIFFWVQSKERYGLFARRFASNGQITTGVAPEGVTSLAMHELRFVPGTGLRGWMSVPSGTARLDIFDAAGRRVSSSSVEAASNPIEVTAPGTSTLRSGIYFGRLSAAGAFATTRAAVIR